MSKPNYPIGYSHLAQVVLLRNGRWKSLESYPGKGPRFLDSRSRKEERAKDKTIRLAQRRLARGGKFL
jgi:hypothetical protein